VLNDTKQKERTKMKKIIQISFFIVSLTLISNMISASNNKQYNTIHLKAFQLSSKEFMEGAELYHKLKEKGYIAYGYFDLVRNKQLFIVRVGCFENMSEAKKLSDEIKKEEGLDCLVVRADYLRLDKYKDKYKIITTPAGIWLEKGKTKKEIYLLAEGHTRKNITERVRILISPSGTGAVFYFKQKIIKIDIEQEQAYVLFQDTEETQLSSSILEWSYDGKYIAYIDAPEFEFPASLWVMKADGSERRSLVKHDYSSNDAVKSFHWHPNKNLIFFVEGYTWGTVTVGGDLFSVDLKGNRKTIIVADRKKGEEIFRDFRIENNTIYYKIVHFDKEYIKRHYTEHEFKITN
jgi:hypothetical protein